MCHAIRSTPGIDLHSFPQPVERSPSQTHSKNVSELWTQDTGVCSGFHVCVP
jgi:hypothetical protein